MKGEPVKYHYYTQLEWTSEKKGVLRCEGKPDIMVACPPEFGGHPGIWSSEDLFLASVEICTMTTFLWFADKEHLTIKSYTSKANATAELDGGVFRFSSIKIRVNIGVSSENDRKTVEKILKKVERACLITNSIQTDVRIEPEIFVG
ncbi:MAG: OsmC family protein [Thermoplasmatales archaeon]|nr:OsmC family protein [Thermoplasmatales archaeon]